MPLGLSFYIFQTAGYLIDVYRGKLAAERNFLHYLLFASYFPQMVQGGSTATASLRRSSSPSIAFRPKTCATASS